MKNVRPNRFYLDYSRIYDCLYFIKVTEDDRIHYYDFQDKESGIEGKSSIFENVIEAPKSLTLLMGEPWNV